jgi:hypothetical protein
MQLPEPPEPEPKAQTETDGRISRTWCFFTDDELGQMYRDCQEAAMEAEVK